MLLKSIQIRHVFYYERNLWNVQIKISHSDQMFCFTSGGFAYRLNNLHIGFPAKCEADDQRIAVPLSIQNDIKLQ